MVLGSSIATRLIVPPYSGPSVPASGVVGVVGVVGAVGVVGVVGVVVSPVTVVPCSVSVAGALQDNSSSAKMTTQANTIRIVDLVYISFPLLNALPVACLLLYDYISSLLPTSFSC